MSEQRQRPKAKFERNVKTCTIEIVGKRYGLNPETLKTMSAFFSMTGTFTIDSNKRFAGWSLTKIVKPFKFSWMETFSVTTKVFLHDGATTMPLDISDEMQFGVNFELSEPKRITTKEAQALIDAGAKVVELDEDDKIRSLALAKFTSR